MAEIVTTSDAGERASSLIAAAIDTLLKRQQQVVLAVAGGRSVVSTFERLAQLTAFAWSNVQIFMTDERLVPLDNPESNFKLVKEKLLDPLLAAGALPEKNVHPFVFNPGAADAGIGAYEAELKQCGGRYDIALLGVGEDGHVGALYPNHHSIKSDAAFYITMDDSPKPPPRRMTASLTLLGRSSYAIALVLGEAKRNTLKRYRDQTLTVTACPVKLIDGAANGYLVTDLV